ncbi:uncharacterized protein TRIADDRAFT_62491 [Trichoplax adhaerens]|uniref:JmjC domain-containing protein n=1 Tax=Trichoplax adhaerens TaxID=10228 RepID=B3SDY7_TRIAD|nr:hypothetical protein TRIADDRAFT_62491 [Trichoplax adhaerens]EDV19055.1 hypothetical protein TRIADDRAFT_62491 [Trichoplax adhaerens]|eukprot:XP_002118456.1 hypothetical protein TRIADDRAFT_62491 [Trichoplax adhaerens]
MIEEWASRQWTPRYFTDQLGDLPVKVKIGPNAATISSNNPILETDCCYEVCTMQEYNQWLNKDPNCGNLNQYDPDLCWCYVDYQYIALTFQAYPEIPQSIDWSKFGLNGRKGDQSTFWMGSKGASTPCHYDSYGCNLVAQLYGRKKWLLVAPDESQYMYPIRVPYEESSIFSAVNMKSPNLVSYPKFANVTIYEVILEPGDVLFVPKYWWHDVECLETAISVNTWIALPSDGMDRLCEAVTKTVVFALKSAEGNKITQWLNPSEVPTSYQTNIGYLKNSLEQLMPKLHTDFPNLYKDDLLDRVINSLLSPDLIKVAAERIISSFTASND